MIFKQPKDKSFIENLKPRPGEPVHSDLYSQIFDYVYNNYGDWSFSERSNYIRELLAYKEGK